MYASSFFGSSFLRLSVAVFIILIAVPTSFTDEEQYKNCNITSPCGVLPNIQYPFWGGNRHSYCGHPGFHLSCPENGVGQPMIKIGSTEYVVYAMESNNTMKVGIVLGDVCANPPRSTTLDFNYFNYVESSYRNLTLFFNCKDPATNWGGFKYEYPGGNDVYYADDRSLEGKLKEGRPKCLNEVKIAVIQHEIDRLLLKKTNLLDSKREGFLVQYQQPYQTEYVSCLKSGGFRSSDPNTNGYSCTNSYGQRLTGKKGSSRQKKEITIIGLTAGGVGSFLMGIIFCFFKRKNGFIHFCRKLTKSAQDLEAFIRNYGPLPIRRYGFADVKRMTNSFKEKLGKGGYGSVFKGKLHDNRLVAVKVLNISKKDGEEFINEVASISRTSHVNIVTLLGYCIGGEKRALIYEFMPNGSLEKFIYKDNPLRDSQDLGWEKVYQIAMGIAQGLEYLHVGCQTQILHLDIKPHNILLDEDFCPKISDFGLAKLATRKESIVSMMEARGTIGYIAPEVFSRSFGHVSHKSDVYSYGMMILEMVGHRKNSNLGISHTSEIYFPHWIYDQLKTGEALRLPGIVNHEENEIAKKMALVGLWCIQTLPSNRPSMNDVIEMLKGSMDALQVPPKPFITSPEMSPLCTSFGHMSQCDATA